MRFSGGGVKTLKKTSLYVVPKARPTKLKVFPLPGSRFDYARIASRLKRDPQTLRFGHPNYRVPPYRVRWQKIGSSLIFLTAGQFVPAFFSSLYAAPALFQVGERTTTPCNGAIVVGPCSVGAFLYQFT